MPRAHYKDESPDALLIYRDWEERAWWMVADQTGGWWLVRLVAGDWWLVVASGWCEVASKFVPDPCYWNTCYSESVSRASGIRVEQCRVMTYSEGNNTKPCLRFRGRNRVDPCRVSLLQHHAVSDHATFQFFRAVSCRVICLSLISGPNYSVPTCIAKLCRHGLGTSLLMLGHWPSKPVTLTI